MRSDATRVEVELAADAQAASQARTVVSQATAKLPGDLSFRARLAASELVTNSVVHPQDRPEPLVRLAVATSPSGVRVEVRDGGAPFESAPRHPSEQTTSGRGLRLVDVLVDRWGTNHADGNLVWFEIDTPTDEQPNPPEHQLVTFSDRRSHP
jgi:anti-sigma regulatory factor (Ser/Thr protein kinase)